MTVKAPGKTERAADLRGPSHSTGGAHCTHHHGFRTPGGWLPAHPFSQRSLLAAADYYDSSSLPWPWLTSPRINLYQLQSFPMCPPPWAALLAQGGALKLTNQASFWGIWKAFHLGSDYMFLKKQNSPQGLQDTCVLSCDLGRRETRHLGERKMRPVEREEHRGKAEAASRQRSRYFSAAPSGPRDPGAPFLPFWGCPSALSDGPFLLRCQWVFVYCKENPILFLSGQSRDISHQYLLCARPCPRHLLLSFF